MPLQPRAQEQVEEKLKELFEAYKAGYNYGLLGVESIVREITPDLYDFKLFLEGSHPVLATYFDPRLWE